MIDGAPRRFACTSCGRCCDGGPEMELGEAAALSGVFITRALFKVHSLPLFETSRRAAVWHRAQKSEAPVGQALAEMREHLARFSVRDEIDKAKGRSLHLTISAIAVNLEPARCPALRGNMCGIYDQRPLTCRTVPLHYSRPASALAGYLDDFVSRPGHACDASLAAPEVLKDRTVMDAAVGRSRAAALAMQAADLAWKREIVAAMSDAETASAYGLPTHDVVHRKADAGVASAVSMLGPWRLARRLGLLSERAFEGVCRDQRRLVAAALAERVSRPESENLEAMRLDYDIEISQGNGHALGVRAQNFHQEPWSRALLINRAK